VTKKRRVRNPFIDDEADEEDDEDEDDEEEEEEDGQQGQGEQEDEGSMYMPQSTSTLFSS
jgi:hypothetical protein